MPQLLRHIDAIARQECRDVLFVTFYPDDLSLSELQTFIDSIPDWETLPIRKQITEWLDTQKISWEPCGERASENSIIPYLGTIYIKLPYDEQNPDYQKLRDYLENPDGSMRFDTARFCYTPLSSAMENAHHDEPGFWEEWAENF
jgi:hypothetical protein